MALTFNEGAYGQAYNMGLQNEQADRDKKLALLQSAMQNIGGGLQSYQEGQDRASRQEQENKLYEMKLAEATARLQDESMLDTPIGQLMSGNRISNPVSGMSLLYGQDPNQEMRRPDRPQLASAGLGDYGTPMGRGGLVEKFRDFQQGRLKVPTESIAQEPDTSYLQSLGIPPEAMGMTPRQLEQMGKVKKLFVEAGAGDYYNPEQAEAISSGDPKKLKEAFGGKIPKGALTTSISSENRDKSNELRLAKEDEDRIRNIRNDIQGSQPYKDWRQIKNASDNLQNAASNPTAKRSLGALYSYIKALDPNSVVREGEISLSQEARSGFERVEGFFNKLAKGQVLNPDEIKEVADWALEKEQMARQSAIDSNTPSINQAKRRGYNINEINDDLFGASAQQKQNVLTKTQRNKKTGETRTLKSTDGGQTWQPM